MSGLSLWLVPDVTQMQHIQGLFPKRPETRRVSYASYPEITPHVTLASSGQASEDTMLRSIPSDLRPIQVKFQNLEIGDHYFRSVFISVKKTPDLVALHEHIMATLAMNGASPSAPVFPHMSISYIAEEDGDAERKQAAHGLRVSMVEDSNLGGEETIVLNCGNYEEQGVQISTFVGTEVWIVRCEGPVQHWQVLQKVPTTLDVA